MSSDKLTLNTSVPTPVATGAMQRKHASAPDEQVSAISRSEIQRQQENKVEPVDINAVASRIESYLKSVNRALEFKVDSASGRTIVTVRDAENGELIRQIPNEEVLRFAQLAEEQTVVLLNEKV